MVQLDRFKVNLLLKELREGESSVTSLSLLGILDLSQLEPEYLLAVFDKLKEFGTVYQYLDEHPQPGLVRILLEKIAAGNLKTCTQKILTHSGFQKKLTIFFTLFWSPKVG